ncbi:MAG TPA: hypothetical protein VJG85_01240 [Patescibacteria group bacterium]|nr:hypothetical protein [Patescibacteria group bacterium]
MNGSLKNKLIVTLKVVTRIGLLAGFLLGPAAKAAQPLDGCVYYELPQPEGFLTHSWPAAPEGATCMVTIMTEAGQLNVVKGWVFDAPLLLNGNEYPTHTEEGEAAAQLDPSAIEVTAGQSLIWDPTWNPDGSQIGFWYTFYPEGQVLHQDLELSYGEATEVFTWEGTPLDTPELHVMFTETGTFTMSGWVFTTPLLLNGEPVETETVPGEAAPQIVEFSAEVSDGESWIFHPSWTVNQISELGLRYSYQPPKPTVFYSFIPIAFRALELLQKTVTISSANTLEPIVANWPVVQNGQEACMVINFIGNGNAVVESGWYFGADIRATLNDGIINIPTHTIPGENATQIDSFRLPHPQTATFCIDGNGGGGEIGLRMNYPTP